MKEKAKNEEWDWMGGWCMKIRDVMEHELFVILCLCASWLYFEFSYDNNYITNDLKWNLRFYYIWKKCKALIKWTNKKKKRKEKRNKQTQNENK